jgi:alkanesulfonate monooxygenase SsuD/methylene tetrahydromethanopterin reductase-like flavin-dependent oxidoreductase (luciferase family)
MRFGFLSEAETELGTTHYQRYHQVVDEVIFAEAMGFDFFGTSEQHFISPLATVSAPESFYPFIAAKTSRIKLRHMIVVLPFPFNHPVRVAERIATEDIVSHGRTQLGTGRANTLLQLDGFQCPLDETRARWDEALDIIMKAFLNDPFSHEGKYFKIPPRSLSPKPVQQPHPPVFMVCQSEESHGVAAQKGIGTLSWDMYMGWDYFEKGYRIYRDNVGKTKPVGGFVNNSFGAVSLNAVCAETVAEARKAAHDSVMRFVIAVVDELYPDLGKRSKSYGYTLLLETIKEKAHDYDWVCNETSVLVGDPNTFIERCRQYQTLGADEIILRLDGNHQQIMRSLDLIGRYVIPAINTPKALVTPSELPGPVP